ncbi:hypothetical protein GTV32_09820 [Gordonia sp. SID5947]|uniref:hypothetical protein n=1 Tax=Gordonia sp. SID5947 TaxID=2690315 RepID=UPI00136BB988|nr:hypothetical protein [Gordonia sp. SID5947]MYR06589.1 hypothetical protein [Gordonia sp. SID5947]
MTSPDVVGELCEQGLAAEMAGRVDEAALHYERAWNDAESSFDRCLAAHYCARTAPTAEERLRWTRVSVEFSSEIAEAGNDERIYSLLPALQIAHAAALLTNGDKSAARNAYLRAADSVYLLHGRSADAMVLHSTIYEGLSATGFVPQGASREFFELVESLKTGDAWGPLAVVLSAFVQNSGTDEAVAHFAITLRELYATGLLNPTDQKLLRDAVGAAQKQMQADSARIEDAAPSQDPGDVSSAQPIRDDADPFGADSPNVAFRI